MLPSPRISARAGLAWVLLLAGCQPYTAEESCNENPDPAVAVGTGESTFEALATGDPVPIIHGPQGGWHIWTSMRLTAMPEYVRARVLISVVDSGEVISDYSYNVAVLEEDSCHAYYPGMYGYVDAVPDGEGNLLDPQEYYNGTELLMRLEVTGLDGSTPVAGEVAVVGTPGGDQGDF